MRVYSIWMRKHSNLYLQKIETKTDSLGFEQLIPIATR